jgi:hypothetical protein
MGCTCARPSDEMLFREFFAKLKIREFDAPDLTTCIQMKLGKSNKITKSKWDKLKDNIVAKEDAEIQGHFFDELHSRVEHKELESALLILSLLLLCKPKPEQFASSFIECIKIMNYEFSLLTDRNSHVKTDVVKKVVEFYTRMVSQDAVKHVAAFVNHREEFEKYYAKVYSESNIKDFVDSVFKDFKEESICLDDFVKTKYQALTNDGIVRSNLNDIFMKTTI